MDLAWRIYYSDGTTFDSSMGSPSEAPGLGIAVIVQPDPDTGRVLMCKWDYYFYHQKYGQWWGADSFGIIDQLTSDRAGDVVAVKAGRTMHSPEYKELYNRAVSDPDFARKSGRLPEERGF